LGKGGDKTGRFAREFRACVEQRTNSVVNRSDDKEAKMKRILLITGFMAMSLSFAGISSAATATGNLQVTATVASVCSVSTTAVNFGAVTGDQVTYANGDITVTCPPNTAYNIALDAGQASDIQGRHLSYSDGQQQIISGPLYYLAKDSNLELIWGDSDFANTYSLGSSLSDTGSGSAQIHTVYGYLINFSGIPAETVMSDMVVVTVHY
jgi:spore coat protein U-like protein